MTEFVRPSARREFQGCGKMFVFDGDSLDVQKPDGSVVPLTTSLARTLLALLVNDEYVNRDTLCARLGLRPGDSSISARVQQLVDVIGDGFEIERKGQHGRRIQNEVRPK